MPCTICCGDDATVTNSEFSDVSPYSFTISLSSNEIDVRAFGDGEYGNWIACAKAGTVSLQSYCRPELVPGDSLTFTGTICDEDFSIPVIVTGQDFNVDAKEVVNFSTTMRITGDPTF
jgi:hypothetical protein